VRNLLYGSQWIFILGLTFEMLGSLSALVPDDIQLFDGALKNSEPRVRARALRVIATIKGSHVTKWLWERLAKEENEEVRDELRKAIRRSTKKGKE